MSISAPTVWLLDGAALDDAALAPFERWLGADETARLGRFTRPARRRQFVAGRALLRQVLAPMLGLEPPDIALTQVRSQGPRLTRSCDHAPFFSLSHSGRWIACAVSAAAPVGVDIERLDARRDVAALAGQAFGAEEAAALAHMGAPARLACFYHLWCSAEARFKLGAPVAQEASLFHPDLAIVLCGAQAFAGAPLLREARLC